MAHRVERVGARAVGVRVARGAERRLAAGSASLKRPCSIAAFAYRARIRARSGLRSFSGSSASARSSDSRESVARPATTARARQLEQVRGPARLGGLVDVSSAVRSSASDRPFASLMRAPPARRSSPTRSPPASWRRRALAATARARAPAGRPPRRGRAPLGGVGGADAGHDAARGAPPAGSGGDAGGAARPRRSCGLALERAGEREAQLMLAGQQVVVDDLAQQRVAERVAAALVGDDHVRLRRLAQRGADLGGVEAARLGEHGVGEHAPGRERAAPPAPPG